MHEVYLQPYEIERAAWVGVRRNVEAVLGGKAAGWGSASDCWRPHIQGAAAELAVAKFLGTYWEGHVNTFQRRPDVMGAEVRWSSVATLKRRPKDPADMKYILVTGEIPRLTIHGWMWGHEIEALGNYADPGERGVPAWFISAEQLHPMSEFQ
jgi:hypothetical protein